MRRGREGHKNNELGREEGTPEKKKQDKAEKAEQTTEYTVWTERDRGGLILISGESWFSSIGQILLIYRDFESNRDLVA